MRFAVRVRLPRLLFAVGDTIFAVGALVLGWFVLGLVTGHSFDKRGYVEEGEWEVRRRGEPAVNDGTTVHAD
jgi:hypothetical protein